MTEREQLIAWLDRCDIPYWDFVSAWEPRSRILVGDPYFRPDSDWKHTSGIPEKVKGYASFFTEFVFDNNGVLLEMGAWE